MKKLSSIWRRYKYDVAFSFAEEDRHFVDHVAEQLSKTNVSCFYDNHKRTESWGEDLNDYLDKVYRSQARFCIIFISQHYHLKRWTQHEKDRALARSFFNRNKAYILPFRLDNTETPGLSDSIAYLSKERYDEETLVQTIIAKVKQSRKERTIWHFLLRRPALLLLVILMLLSAIADCSLYLFSGRSTLTARTLELFHLRDKWHFSNVCSDGWLSESSGRGTCSHHGPVQRPIDTMMTGPDRQACRKQYIRSLK